VFSLKIVNFISLLCSQRRPKNNLAKTHQILIYQHHFNNIMEMQSDAPILEEFTGQRTSFLHQEKLFRAFVQLVYTNKKNSCIGAGGVAQVVEGLPRKK
jgi:hypothetical protein